MSVAADPGQEPDPFAVGRPTGRARGGWTNLFDTANESILSDIVEPDAVDVELVSGGEESTDAAEGADGLGILDDIE